MKAAVLFLVLAGCTAASPVLPPPTGDTVTVFVHGYRGAFLVTDDADRTRAYLSVDDVVSTGRETLALPYDGQPAPPSFPKLVADGPLTKLTILPGLISMDIYLTWLEFGRDQLPGFVPWAYDWRQDVLTTSAQFCAFLKALPAQNINIVAHSMGGYVTWGCLASDEAVAQRIRKVVFAGTPFKGGPNAFKSFMLGSPTGLNGQLLSREAVFTFGSTYQLLSRESDFFVDAAGARVPLNAYDPMQWVDGRWGVFAGNTTLAEVAVLRQRLEGHDAMHARLQQPLLGAPEILAVIGHGHATVSGVRVTPQGFDFGNPPTADGDGSVLLTSAEPPGPFTRLDTTTEHVQLLNDPEVQRAIAAFLHSGK